MALNGPKLAGEKQLSETHELSRGTSHNRLESLLAGCTIDVMSCVDLPLQPQTSALLCEPQESQHEINIFYAKTTHGFRTVAVIMWIPQTCDLCLSCEHVRTTVPVSATKQTSLCVCGLCFPQPAQARAAPAFLPAPPSGPEALADCGS